MHGGKLFTICVLNDGLLATGGSDNKIYIWDIDRLQHLGVLQGHTGSIACLDFQENLLVSASFDTFIRLWTTEKIARQDDQSFIR